MSLSISPEHSTTLAPSSLMPLKISCFLSRSAPMNESRSSALVIFNSASLTISLILMSPSKQMTFASRIPFGRSFISTLLRIITPLTKRVSLAPPVPVLNMDTCCARASPRFSNTVFRASTINGENTSRADSATFPRSEVSATARSLSSSVPDASFSICETAACREIPYPSTRVRGCIPFLKRLFASINSDPHSSIPVVTPSPQSSSWDSAIETIIFAAGCLTNSSATIFAPSLVTAVVPSVL